MEEVEENETKRQPVKWWIRRHRVLSLLAPFAIATIAFTLVFAVQCDSLADMLDAAKFGFLASIYGLATFTEGIRHYPFTPMWYAEVFVWPFYVLPAIAFVFSRNAKVLIFAYAVYCVLVVLAIYSGIGILLDGIGSC